MANDSLVKWLTVRHRPDDVWAIVPLLPEPLVKPTVQEAEDAPQASSTAPVPAAVPFAPRQNGVFGWREVMVPLESNAQSSFCLAPWPHGSEGMQWKPDEAPCQLQVCGGGQSACHPSWQTQRNGQALSAVAAGCAMDRRRCVTHAQAQIVFPCLVPLLWTSRQFAPFAIARLFSLLVKPQLWLAEPATHSSSSMVHKS